MLGCALLLLKARAAATIKVSHDDGDWNSVYWAPEGVPEAGDTVIITSNVTGMPNVYFGQLIVRAGGSLRISGAAPVVGEAVVMGLVYINTDASLHVRGNLTNSGVLGGGGTVYVASNGARVAGGGTYGAVAVSAPAGSVVYGISNLTFSSLTLSSGTQLTIGENDLTINGPYTSASQFGDTGIVAGDGTIRLNGPVYGSAFGNVVLGTPPNGRPSRRPRLPDVHGTLGRAMSIVEFSASRRLLFCRISGDVRIGPGAIVEGGGLANGGENVVIGSLTVHGTVRTSDERYRWVIEGDLFNQGSIESGTYIFSGFRTRLRTDQGTWDPSINLIYNGPSGGEMQLQSPVTVSKLTIAPRTPLDSNVAVMTGSYVLKIRHLFTSDTTRGCRIITDTIVRIMGASNGAVSGGVNFEGFWGSAVSGNYGAAGKQARFVVRKRIAGRTVVNGPLAIDPQALVPIAAPLTAQGTAQFRGRVELDHTEITLNGSLACDRDISGTGTLRMIAAHPTLDMRGAIPRGVTMVIGTDSTTSRVDLLRTLHASALVINDGSSIGHRTGDSLDVTDSLEIVTSYPDSYSSAAVPCRPADLSVQAVFPGSVSVLHYENNTYVEEDTVEIGVGYFVLFQEVSKVVHRGRPLNLPLVIPIRAGWNLIGAASVRAQVTRITVAGTTLLSGFLPAQGAGAPVNELEPGRGYWVNAAGAGTLTLNPDP